jgi:hypothetical protein
LRIRSVARSLLVPVHVRTTWIALLISLGSGRPCSSHPIPCCCCDCWSRRRLRCIAAVHTGPHMRRVLSCRGCSLCVCTVAGSPHPLCGLAFQLRKDTSPYCCTIYSASSRCYKLPSPSVQHSNHTLAWFACVCRDRAVKDSRLVQASGRRRGRPFCCTVAIILLRKVPALSRFRSRY